MNKENINNWALSIAQKEFDKSKISKTQFLEWNGSEAVDCSEIEKLYLSYDFEAMQNKVISPVKINKIKNQLQNYFLYKTKQNRISRLLLSMMLLFVVILLLFAEGIVSNYFFYSSVVVLYLVSINYPVVIRKKLRKYRFIDLK